MSLHPNRRCGAVLARVFTFAFLVIPGVAAAADADAQRVRGTVQAVAGNSLTMRTPAGQDVQIALNPDYKVLLYRPLALKDVAPNAYIGVASAPQPDGGSRALAIVVFPEPMRGMNEGNSAWDLIPGSRMSNATVAQLVGTAQTGELTVRFKDERTQRIAVTERTPVSTFAPTTREALAPGARAIVFASRSADGALTATFVGVGQDGYAPPL